LSFFNYHCSSSFDFVSFNCATGPSEIIRDNVNGYLVKTNDINEMASKINSLIKDENKLKEFSSKSKLDINKFNLDLITDKWTKILSTI
jgi:glycosyltransferase involved in cell wall biosynthesis